MRGHPRPLYTPIHLTGATPYVYDTGRIRLWPASECRQQELLSLTHYQLAGQHDSMEIVNSRQNQVEHVEPLLPSLPVSVSCIAPKAVAATIAYSHRGTSQSGKLPIASLLQPDHSYLIDLQPQRYESIAQLWVFRAHRVPQCIPRTSLMVP